MAILPQPHEGLLNDRFSMVQWLFRLWNGELPFMQSGTGAVAEAVSTALQRMPHSAQYSTAGNFNTAKAALTGTIGLPSVAALGLEVTKTGGTLAAGSSDQTSLTATFTGDSGGTTDAAGLRVTQTSDGANAVAQAISLRVTAKTTGAGAITTQRAVFGEVRLDGAGNVATAIPVSGALVLTSTGSITTGAEILRAASPTITGAGTVAYIDGVRVSNQGHAKVVDVFGVHVVDQTDNTGNTFAFYSAMTAGAAKWDFYSASGAKSHFNGPVLFGSTTDDTTNKVQVTGICVSYSDTQAGAEGGSFKAANNTTKTKFVQIGYDGTADVGYIKALHAATGLKNLVVGTGAAVSTTSVGGFLMIGSCAGTPTGAPTGAAAGRIPMIYDSTNNLLYLYFGSWRSVAVT